MYLVQNSFTLLGQQGLKHFFRYRTLPPIGWRIVQIVRQRRRKMRNKAPTTLSATQAASQSTFINAHLYSTCDSGKDINKQLTLLNQRKLALTAINTFFCNMKLSGPYKISKTRCVPLLKPSYENFCQNFCNLSHEKVPLKPVNNSLYL